MTGRRTRRRGGVGIMVYNFDTTGGMERQAARLAETIAALGRPVVVVTSFFPEKLGLGCSRKDPPLYEKRDGVRIYRVPFFPWWHYPTSQEFYETFAAWVFHKHAASIDTIYAVQAHTGGFHAARIARALERPVVLKLACSGEAGDFVAISREAEPAKVLEQVRSIDRVVHLNDESRDEALAAGVPESRLARIPNGIDLGRFPRETSPAGIPELGTDPERELVVFVGRLDKQKRVSVLVEAFVKLAVYRPKARLAVVGQGPERASLEALARERGLAPDRAAFLGLRSDVPSVLRAAQVFVLPSVNEGLSNALLEALAAGAPIVATDIPGNRGVVRHEQEALVVPPDDVPALERAIDRLLTDRALAERLGRAGRARAESEFAIERVAGRYLELFDSLGKRRPPSLVRFVERLLDSPVVPFTWLFARGLWNWLLWWLWFTRKSASAVVKRLKRKLGIERALVFSDDKKSS